MLLDFLEDLREERLGCSAMMLFVLIGVATDEV